jgi:hypothetical protein
MRAPVPSPSMVVAIAALSVALGGVAYASINATTAQQDVIVACADRHTGVLRLANDSRKCRRSERKVSWDSRLHAYFASSGGDIGEPQDLSHRVSVRVPPGAYLASGGCTAWNPTPPNNSPLAFAQADASVTSTATPTPSNPGGGATASVPNQGAGYLHGRSFVEAGSASLSDQADFSLPSGGVITQGCSATVVGELYLSALKTS